MPDAALRELVERRLEAETKAADTWAPLVLAALDGPAELAALLDAQSGSPNAGPSGPLAEPKTPGPEPNATALAAKPIPPTAAGSAAKPVPPDAPSPTAAGPNAKLAPPSAPVHLRSITVRGFRGIGAPATLELVPGPGLTLVVGRNGSGKSSFAEALELLLTQRTYRFHNRSAVWREGWRNLHEPQAALTATFALEGSRGLTVSSSWPEGKELDEAETWAQLTGAPRTERSALAWEDALSRNSPILSYNELGSMLDEGPSKLYDALSGILGLDELVHAQTALQKARAPRESRAKEAQEARKRLDGLLAASDDPRARDAERLLAAGQPLSLPPDSGPPPTLPDVAPVIDELRRAATLADAAAGTLAGRAHELACLLDQALAFHQTHGGDCPVCGAPLGPDWRSERLARLATLRQDARTAAEGRAAVERALARARGLVVPAIEEARGFLLDTDDPRALADHLEAAFVPLRAAVLRLRQTGAERDERWRPLAAALAAYVPPDRESVSLLKKAEAWLKDASDAVRAERFRPVADHARALWEKLRHESNVSLDSISLGGTGKGRRVDLAVTVDGCAGAALGVMSQGEQNALALSIFIPRATLPESPFRFLVIDDPVQSMDPARVDGLARVLHQTSTDRQVIVFTHDDRLPEPLRRLALPATVLEVCRGAGSVVSVRPVRDPASRALEDARAVALSTNLPPEAVRRVVPGLVREAIEAACMEAVRRRRIGKGESHSAVETLLDEQTTKALVALALFDDPDAKDVMPRLDKQSRAFADVCRYAVEGAHEPRTDLALDRGRDAEKLVHWLRAQS